MPGLSKSKYTKFCQCDKALWLKINKPELEVVDDATKGRFEKGREVGDLAKGFFGNYKEAHAEKPDGSLDLAAMTEQTRQWMAEGVENICEASFLYEGNYCAVDILHKTPGGWTIYEVKSVTYPDEKDPKKIDKYIPDIAYQKWVLTQCGVKVTGTYLVCLNKEYVRHGDLDISELFIKVDMEEKIAGDLLSVPVNVERAMKTMERMDEPTTDLNMGCHKPYPCGFWKYCTRHLPQPSVFDVYGGIGRGGFTFEKKLNCYKAGDITFDKLRDKNLGDIQNLQVACTLDQCNLINRDGIKEFLDELQYPLYFLDFETMQDTIPQYDDAKPSAQLCFQYSLHIKMSPDAPYEHREYLAPSNGGDPRRELAVQLCQDIPLGACTLVYNKDFECTRLKEMAEIYTDLADHLLDIKENIKDLLVPFRKGYYYVPAMGGSFSIKSVLPALFPNEPTLNYHNLDERVQNGGDAMNIFPKIKDMDPDEAAATREALLRYCELDTWAMVKVWEQLQAVAK